MVSLSGLEDLGLRVTTQKSNVAKALLFVSLSGPEGLGFRVTPQKNKSNDTKVLGTNSFVKGAMVTQALLV